MAYPSFNPEWAIEDTYSDGTTPNKIRPDEGLRDHGYTPFAEPTAQNLNWQFNNIYQQLVELKSQLSTPNQTPINELKYIVGDNRNPAVIYGYGVWVKFAEGRTVIGSGVGTDVNGTTRTFNEGQTGGEYNHTMTTAEMPSHSHQLRLQYQGNNKASEGNAYASNGEVAQNDFVGTDTRITDSTGGGQAFNLMNPYQVVNIWLRVE
jgi:hypothetical protein